MTKRDEWMGDYNDIPSNYEEITSDKFWYRFLMQLTRSTTGSHYVTREPATKKGQKLFVKLKGKHLRTWYDNNAQVGVGIVEKIHNAFMVTPEIYFSFHGCVHKYETQNLGRCWNRYTCKKCGHSYESDSSD